MGCFGDEISMKRASAICFGESGGIADKKSDTDKCAEDGNVYSHGLFQINLTVHDIGLGCQKAFENTPANKAKDGPTRLCTNVINAALYDKCVAKAGNKIFNINFACSLVQSDGWDSWGYNSSVCKFSRFKGTGGSW
jgi:hypothetical protein